MKYRKKPVVIEAVQYLGNKKFSEVWPYWVRDAFKSRILELTNGQDPLIISTLEGNMVVALNDFLIKGIQGELYPCKPDIFQATYEKV